MATPSYKERLAAARAATRAERQAREQAWKRRIELECEVRRLALDAVKAGIRARGDKLQLLRAASEARLGSRDCKLVGAAVVRRRFSNRSTIGSFARGEAIPSICKAIRWPSSVSIVPLTSRSARPSARIRRQSTPRTLPARRPLARPSNATSKRVPCSGTFSLPLRIASIVTR